MIKKNVAFFKAAGKRLFHSLGIESYRTKNISLHVLLSILYKGGSILIGFLMIPLTIRFLDNENYGVWLTLSSFISWFTFFDIGLGNGLRNKFSESVSKSDFDSARSYVSTTYFTVLFVSLLLLFAFLIANIFVDWSGVFNISEKTGKNLNILMPIVFGLFCIQLVLKLVATIYTADQHHSMQGKLNFFIQLAGLISIVILNQTSKASLFLYGFVISIIPVLVLLVFNFLAFKGRYKFYRPSLRFCKTTYLKDVFGLGAGFFIIQLAGVILFTTDNFIITQLFGASEVVPYNISYKYFATVNMLLSIVFTPYWSSITNAFTQGDYEWIKRAMKNLTIMSLSSVLVIAVMIFFSDKVYHFWIGDKVHVPMKLTFFMGLFFMIYISYSPFTYFINGTGKIKLQMLTVVLMSLVNIPLAIFLASYKNMGVSGVIFSTMICLLPHAILLPVQYSKIIRNKAKGIWNQ